MDVTKKTAAYLEDIGINLGDLARKTNISYEKLYTSFRRPNSTRKLSADEFIAICKVIRRRPDEVLQEDF